MELHDNEILRNTFRVLLAFHIIVLFFTREGNVFETSETLQNILEFCYSYWPFPTMKMSIVKEIDMIPHYEQTSKSTIFQVKIR